MREPDRPPSLERGFEALRATIGREVPPGASYARLVDTLERRARTARRWRLGLVVASSAAVVLMGLGVWRMTLRATGGGFAIVALGARGQAWVTPDGALEVSGGEVALRATELDAAITVLDRARLRREATGVRLVAGRARFVVTSRPDRAALRVLVSHGTITVWGTRFLVDQNEAGGEVWLEEGRIRFLAADGRERVLSPGERLRWPLAADAPPPASSPTPPVASAPPPAAAAPPRLPRPGPRQRASAPEVRRYLAEIDALRIRRDYRELAKRLTAALAAGLDEPLAERLSVELGDVLARHSDDRDRACQQLAAHLRHYPRGRSRAEVIRTARQLRCVGHPGGP
jgi:transmembrane sensor